MRVGLPRFAADDRGVAAVEFALILPILVTVLMVGADLWLKMSQQAAMRAALQTGARYYQSGGVSDVVAQSVALQAWSHPPADAGLVVARSCACGSTATACTNLCNAVDPPSVFITFTAQGTFSGLSSSRALSETDVLRLR